MLWVVILIAIIIVVYMVKKDKSNKPTVIINKPVIVTPNEKFEASINLDESQDVHDRTTRSTGYYPHKYPKKFKNAPVGLYNPLR